MRWLILSLCLTVFSLASPRLVKAAKEIENVNGEVINSELVNDMNLLRRPSDLCLYPPAGQTRLQRRTSFKKLKHGCQYTWIGYHGYCGDPSKTSHSPPSRNFLTEGVLGKRLYVYETVEDARLHQCQRSPSSTPKTGEAHLHFPIFGNTGRIHSPDQNKQPILCSVYIQTEKLLSEYTPKLYVPHSFPGVNSMNARILWNDKQNLKEWDSKVQWSGRADIIRISFVPKSEEEEDERDESRSGENVIRASVDDSQGTNLQWKTSMSGGSSPRSTHPIHSTHSTRSSPSSKLNPHHWISVSDLPYTPSFTMQSAFPKSLLKYMALKCAVDTHSSPDKFSSLHYSDVVLTDRGMKWGFNVKGEVFLKRDLNEIKNARWNDERRRLGFGHI
ncbi:hypothetical protein BKA69DRAFT_810653 [Paraphysoderma sedebokerense]|nr:hypothetical protein BKA69DRAFT_810653 [Paraphysoderma sedebokerense]